MTVEKSIEFLKALLLPSTIGVLVGFSAMLVGVYLITGILGVVLRVNPIGYLIFGSYYLLLGVAGLASFYINVDELKSFVEEHSIVKWMAGIAGVVTGLAIAALCKNSGQDAVILFSFSFLFFAITWVVWYFEKLIFTVPRNEKNIIIMVAISSSISMVVGAISLCHAWQLVCSCGGQ